MLEFENFDRRARLDLGASRIYLAGPDPAHASLPLIILVPGAYHGAWCYSHYLDYFERMGISCAAVDLPGQGSLAGASGAVAIGIEDLAGYLAQACLLLDRPVVLVGHSMGALPVLLAAPRVNVAGVALLSPSPPGNAPGARALAPVALERLNPAPGADEVRSRFLGTSEQIDVRPVLARMNPQSPVVLNDRYLLRVAVEPSSITCPGICFEAELDRSDRHPPGQDCAVAKFLGFEYALLASQPHCMMYGNRWEESAAALLSWYRRICAAPLAGVVAL